MSNNLCSICHRKIDDYHVKINGTYYHYSPCCVEKFKKKRNKDGRAAVKTSDLSDDESSPETQLPGDAETVDELPQPEGAIAFGYTAGV